MPTTRAPFPDDATAIDAVAAGFTDPGSPVDAAGAHCIADGLVHVFGRDKVADLGFGTGRWTLHGSARDVAPWNHADSAAVVDTLRVCTPAWKLLMVAGAATGAVQLSDESARCLADAIADDRAHDLFITLLERPDGPALAAARAELDAADASCRTPQEQAALPSG